MSTVDTTRVITMQDIRNSINDRKLCVWGMDYFLTTFGYSRQDLILGHITVQHLLDSEHAVAIEFINNLHDVE